MRTIQDWTAWVLEWSRGAGGIEAGAAPSSVSPSSASSAAKPHARRPTGRTRHARTTGTPGPRTAPYGTPGRPRSRKRLRSGSRTPRYAGRWPRPPSPRRSGRGRPGRYRRRSGRRHQARSHPAHVAGATGIPRMKCRSADPLRGPSGCHNRGIACNPSDRYGSLSLLSDGLPRGRLELFDDAPEICALLHARI